MAEERNTRREILKKLVTLGPLAAVAGAFGVNGTKPAEAQTIGDPDVTVTGNLTVNGTGNSSFASKVGVGTPTPLGPLEVVGLTTLTGDQSAILHRNAAQANRFLTGLRNDFSAPDFIFYSFLGNWLFWDANIGVGTPSPVFPLDVVGDIRCTGKLRGTDGAVGNRLGVGTDAPATRLHVDNGTLQVGTTSGREGYIYMFNDVSDSPGGALALSLSGRFGLREGQSVPMLHLDRFSSGWVTPALSIRRDNGYVGIANTNPVCALDVVGDIHLTGTLEGTARKTYYDS